MPTAHGLTQRDLAQKIGVTESAVSQTLFGDGNLKIYTLARYLKALGFEASLELLLPSGSISKPVFSRGFLVEP